MALQLCSSLNKSALLTTTTMFTIPSISTTIAVVVPLFVDEIWCEGGKTLHFFFRIARVFAPTAGWYLFQSITPMTTITTITKILHSQQQAQRPTRQELL